MEGRSFAVIVSLLVWILGYIFSLFYFANRYSKLSFVKSLGEKFDTQKLNYILLLNLIFSPIIVSQVYRIGGIFESGNGIIWGCYIEDFGLATILVLSLSLLGLFILFLLGLINPNLVGFSNRINAFKLYVLHHTYVFILMLIIWYFIPILSGPLSGKEGSCW